MEAQDWLKRLDGVSHSTVKNHWFPKASLKVIPVLADCSSIPIRWLFRLIWSFRIMITASWKGDFGTGITQIEHRPIDFKCYSFLTPLGMMTVEALLKSVIWRPNIVGLNLREDAHVFWLLEKISCSSLMEPCSQGQHTPHFLLWTSEGRV